MPPMCLENSAVQIVPEAIGGSFAPKGERGVSSFERGLALQQIQLLKFEIVIHLSSAKKVSYDSLINHFFHLYL